VLQQLLPLKLMHDAADKDSLLLTQARWAGAC